MTPLTPVTSIGNAWTTYGGDDLDPAHWPIYMWTDVPATYSWALARAYGEAQDDGVDRVPGEDFAKSFTKWLKTAEDAEPTHEACQVLSNQWD